MAISVSDIDDDASLVRAAQAGDGEAYAELFRRHHPSVRRACARRLGDLAEADEVAQAAFVKAYERLDQCAGERRFGAWVHVIAQRLCVDVQRARFRTTPSAEPVHEERAVGPNVPEENVLRAQRARDVSTALASLPERQREVVLLRDVDERRPGEIAAALGVSVGAVDSLLLRARRRLAVAYRATAGETGATTATSSAALAGATAVAGPGGALRALADAAAGVKGLVHQALVMAPSMPSAARKAVATVATAITVAVSTPAPVTAPSVHRAGGPRLPVVTLELPAPSLLALPTLPSALPDVASVAPVAGAATDAAGAVVAGLGSAVPSEPGAAVAPSMPPAAVSGVLSQLPSLPQLPPVQLPHVPLPDLGLPAVPPVHPGS